MQVLIFEDEILTSEQLIRMLIEYDKKIEVIGVIETVKEGLNWFLNNKNPDLIFMDIHLADGSCFEIFSEIKINVPIIFTTAYDQYAIQAFKVNSIDYLLKPVDFDDLKKAIDKFKSINDGLNNGQLVTILQEITKSYKQRFLVNKGDKIIFINTTDIAFFMYDESVVFAYTSDSKRYIIDNTIEKITGLINPNDFYRINRKMVVSLKSIIKIHRYFNNRIKLELKPNTPIEAIVSREKVSGFKKWLDK